MTVPAEIALDLIDVPKDRARAPDPDWVEALAAVIGQQGLTNAITVRPVGARFRLVTGLHRLEAVRRLGWPSIPARASAAASDDAARLEEVMENLCRHKLIALDRCRHLWELKRVWERMYPQAAHGKAPKPKAKEKIQTLALSTDAPEVFGFARATAEKIGLSPASIKAAVTIWTRLHPPLRRRLQGTALARKMTELKALSDLSTNRQVKVLDLIEDPAKPEIGNVAEALEYLENGPLPNAVERRFIGASRTLGALDDILFERVVMAHEVRIVASLKRRGIV